MNKCNLIRETLSAYLDGELTQQESQKVAVHLRDCQACREIYEDFRRMREDIKRLEFPQPSEEQWRTIMGGFAFKTTRGVGWLLWIGGAVVLLAYGLYELIRDPSIHAAERVGVLALILGLVLLFLTVLIERVSALQTDKYKDVEK
ncbi:MAG: anti-sigma factor family protein [Phycisphaerae bacterium]